MLFVNSGGIVSNPTIMTYGTLSLKPGANSINGVDFNGANASLIIGNTAILQGSLTGFAATDSLIFRKVGYGPTTVFHYSGTSAGGTLTVTSGHTTGTALFNGNYTATDFHEAAAVGGGTVITYG